MNCKFLILFALLGCVCCNLLAIDKQYFAFKKRPIIEKIDGNIEISFQLDLTRCDLDKHHRIRVLPVIYKQNRSSSLSKFTITGSAKYLLESRDSLFKNIAYSEFDRSSDYVIGKDKVVFYKYAVKQQMWMDTLSLRLDLVLEDCCSTKSAGSIALLNGITPTLSSYDAHNGSNTTLINDSYSRLRIPIDNAVRFATPIKKLIDCDMLINSIKDYELRLNRYENVMKKDTFLISFEVGKAILDKKYLNNTETLSTLHKKVDLIKNSNHLLLNSIVITGNSTPDNSNVSDGFIARKRIESIKEFIVDEHKINPRFINAVNRGVSWDEAEILIAASNISSRDTLLSIFRKEQPSSVKKQMIKNIDYGETYSSLSKSVFSKLENTVEVVVCYHDRSDREGELISKAIRLIFERDIDKAIELLLSVKNDKRAYNPLGVAYQLKGDTTSAYMYLSIGVEAGDVEAKENLKRLNRIIK